MQERVLQLVMEGKNVFFTGNAGTGKTFMLNQIIQVFAWCGTVWVGRWHCVGWCGFGFGSVWVGGRHCVGWGRNHRAYISL